MSTETPEKISLTQAELDAQIAERLERDRRARGWSEKEAEELKAFRQKSKDAEVEDAKKRKDFDEALKLKDQQHTETLQKEKERGDGIMGRYKGERISNALLAAASSAINPEQVSALLRDRVTLDDDFKPVALDANGKPSGKTVNQLVADFLGENKHFVKATSAGQSQGTAGAGGNSGGDRQGDTGPLGELAKAEAELKAASESGDAQKVIKANTKYQAARSKAKEAGLLSA